MRNLTAKTPSTPRALCVLLVLLAACSANYKMQSAQSRQALQWPAAPGLAKVIYVESLYGFVAGRRSNSVLHAIAGTSKKQSDLFQLPVAIAKGKDGRFAVADIGCNCVHLFIPAKNSYKRITGHDSDVLVSPVGVTFDDDLRLFISDSAGKVLVFTSDASFLFSITTLKRPTGVAYNSLNQRLYVVDTLQNQVSIFDRDGKFIFSFGKRGVKEGEFNFPTHIFCSNTGEVYVTDSLNFRIQIFDRSGNFQTQFGNHGDSSGNLALPKGIATDRDGIIYVVDSLFDNIQLFNREGVFLLTLGARGTQFGEFWLPSGIFADENKLYVCDTYNHRIQVFQIANAYEAQGL